MGRHHQPSLRLQRRLCQLDGWMECAKEGLVLQECWQGLPTRSWRLCLNILRGSVSVALGVALVSAPSSVDALNMHLLASKLALLQQSDQGLNVALAHCAIFRRASSPTFSGKKK